MIMNDLPVPDDVLEYWLMGGPVPEEKLEEIVKSTPTYLITYYYSFDMEHKYRKYDTMKLALNSARLMLLTGDYVIDSITTQYS